MLLNNLDPEVAEHPEELVVYGGSGRAARSHEALRDIVRTLLRLRDDETLLVQSGQAGRRVPHPRRRATRADRQLAARAEMGDVGRVPAARGRGADDVRADDGRLVDLHRHPGDPAGDLSDVLRRGRGALRLAPICPAAPCSRRASAAWAAHSRSRRRWPARRSCASRSISGRSTARLATRYVDEQADSLDDAIERVRAAAAERTAALGGVARRTRPTSSRSSWRAGSDSTSSPIRPLRTTR